VALLAACGGKEPSSDSAPSAASTDGEFVAQARAATNKMQMELKQALSAAMQEGGAVNALGVCKVEAPQIASQVGAATGLRVSRVALRHRNPHNAPTPAQRDVLQYFDAHADAGDTVIVVDARSTYLRPIRVGVDLCLRCHGAADQLDEGVSAKLAELYPQDSATGFSMGDLRGAFVVTRAEGGE
jgi:hypothetical protein